MSFEIVPNGRVEDRQPPVESLKEPTVHPSHAKVTCTECGRQIVRRSFEGGNPQCRHCRDPYQ